MRERREISMKVSGCNDETKEAGGPSRCQPTHRSCPLLSWLHQGRVPGSVLYCIVLVVVLVVRTSGRYLCLFAVMTSSQVTVRMGRPGELLLCWRLPALALLTRYEIDSYYHQQCRPADRIVSQHGSHQPATTHYQLATTTT